MYVKEWKALMKMALITCFLICAQVISAQEKNFSLDLKDVTVKEALEQLKAKTTYSLWFNVNDVDLGRKITVRFQDKSINEALEIILKGQSLSYEIKDKYIQIFKPRKAPEKGKVKQASGIVVDDKGESLPGVSIRFKEDETVGTVTDLDGHFQIKGKNPDRLLHRNGDQRTPDQRGDDKGGP